MLKKILPQAGIFFLAIVIYLPTLSFGLVYLDDNVWIQDYGWLFQDWAQAVRFFTGPDFISNVFYRPVLNLTFLLDVHNPLPGLLAFRFTNILLHAACSCLVYQLFILLQFTRRTSLVVALLFAAHSVSVSAVAWIPGRTDTVLALFSLIAVIAYIHFMNSVADNAHKSKRFLLWGGIHLVSWILALLSKETAVVIPVVCCLYIGCERRQSKIPLRFWVMGGLWGVLGSGFLWVRHALIPVHSRVALAEMVSSAVGNFPALLSYFGKAVIPIGQSVLPHVPDMTLLWGWVALAGFWAALVVFRRPSWKRVCFGLGWFLLFLTPSLVLSFLAHEYRLYLPMIGIAMIAASWGEPEFWSRHKRMGWVFIGIVMLIFAVKTLVFSRYYKDQFVFWTNAVDHSPTLPLAHRNLAAMYHLQGDMQKAREGYLKALELNPYERMANNNLGLIAQQSGDAQSAAVYYQREIQINPLYDTVYFNYGILEYERDNQQRARELWQRTVEVNPHYAQAWKYLYLLAEQAGRRDEMQKLKGKAQRQGVSLP